jgi:AcrR family transcriptional regulator
VTTRRTQAERSATTRRALLDAARDLFAERGFANTGRDDIAERAGVTRGALYHHYGSKERLFRAVVEELEASVLERIMQASMREDDPFERLRLGCLAFLDACMDQAVRRIVLLEAPVVLGWDQWREIDSRHGLAVVKLGVQEAMDAGRISAAPLDPLAHMLLGAMNEAALVVANAARPKRARAEVGEAVDMLLRRLAEPSAAP